jgi:hypothetical protein
MLKYITLLFILFTITSSILISKQPTQNYDLQCCYDQGGYLCGFTTIDCCAPGKTKQTRKCALI